jgi:hypothetical protein
MKPYTSGTTGPPGVYDNGSEFPGNSIALQTRFLSRCSVEEKYTKTGEVAKGKRKARGKTSKASKCTDKHNDESRYTQLGQTIFKYSLI